VGTKLLEVLTASVKSPLKAKVPAMAEPVEMSIRPAIPASVISRAPTASRRKKALVAR
jgi:hypothetical protein